VGGPAEALVQPRSREELSAVVRRSAERNLRLRVLGGGCNILAPDEGVPGVVLRLNEPAFTQIRVEGPRARAGAGAALSALISQSARKALAGLELLVGIPGTVGGALRCNAGDRSGDIGQYVRQVEVLDNCGDIQVREREELTFTLGGSNLDDPVILETELELESDAPDAIVKRMRKAWIQRKASQPLSFQSSVRLFRDPPGFRAANLVEQAGLAQTRVGGAEVSERDANFVIAHPGASARDVLRLIDLIRTKVQERFNLELELQITIW
jgi:UDP-N-acetylmuramate dehydrogenase